MSTPYKESVDPESQALLPQGNAFPEPPQTQPARRTYRLRHVGLAYAAGILSAVLVELLLCSHYSLAILPPQSGSSFYEQLASPDAGSTEVHKFPPAKPTNVFPSLFPTHVGYAGPTPTGAEPALVATAPSRRSE